MSLVSVAVLLENSDEGKCGEAGIVIVDLAPHLIEAGIARGVLSSACLSRFYVFGGRLLIPRKATEAIMITRTTATAKSVV